MIYWVDNLPQPSKSRAHVRSRPVPWTPTKVHIKHTLASWSDNICTVLISFSTLDYYSELDWPLAETVNYPYELVELTTGTIE